MPRSVILTQASGLALAGLTAGLLVACQQKPSASASNVAAAAPPAATIPLADTPGTGPVATAPPAQALPTYTIRHAAAANPQDAYAFAERARYASYGYGDAPPDYGFDYDGVSPWAWQGDNGYTTVVEPLADGDRYYYYAPGEDTPYYVRDPDYGYGYQGGALVVVYDRHGRPLPDADAQRWWGDGGRYFRRGQDLWQASRGQHHAVQRGHWEQRRADLDRDQAWWGQAQSQDPDWRAYDQQNGQQYQDTWRQERYRREAEAYRVDQAYNDGARAQREHDQALVAVGAAGVAGAVAVGVLGHHANPPPAPSVATGAPPPQGAGPRAPFGSPGQPGQTANLRPAAPPTGAPAGQTVAEREAMARQQAALKNQQQAVAAQQAAAQREALARQEAARAAAQGKSTAAAQAAAQQAAAQRAAAVQREALARQQANQAQAARQAEAQKAQLASQQAAQRDTQARQAAAQRAQVDAAAKAKAAAVAQSQTAQAAAQRAAAARQQAAAQAQFNAEQARVARIQAQQAQGAVARQAQAQAQQKADAAHAAQAQSQQKAEAARLTLVQSQQKAEAARQAQVQAQQKADAARQAQVQAQAQARQKSEAAARAKTEAAKPAGNNPGNRTP